MEIKTREELVRELHKLYPQEKEETIDFCIRKHIELMKSQDKNFIEDYNEMYNSYYIYFKQWHMDYGNVEKVYVRKDNELVPPSTFFFKNMANTLIKPIPINDETEYMYNNNIEKLKEYYYKIFKKY